MERTNESGSQLAFDTKAMSSPEWRHLEVCPLTNLESNTTVPFVIIGLLPRLCCLEVLPDDPDLIFYLLDHICTEQLPLTCLGSVQRCPALPAIQDLKGGCLQTCLIDFVVKNSAYGKHSSHFMPKEMTHDRSMSSRI